MYGEEGALTTEQILSLKLDTDRRDAHTVTHGGKPTHTQIVNSGHWNTDTGHSDNTVNTQ